MPVRSQRPICRSLPPVRTRPGAALRRLLATAAVALGSAALAAAPCGELLAPYFEARDAKLRPCLIDLQENGLCFVLPGTLVETAIRTLDAHLQAQGVERPLWQTSDGGDMTRFAYGNGGNLTLELVLAREGPFATAGTCRIVPER